MLDNQYKKTPPLEKGRGTISRYHPDYYADNQT